MTLIASLWWVLGLQRSHISMEALEPKTSRSACGSFKVGKKDIQGIRDDGVAMKWYEEAAYNLEPRVITRETSS